jgi:GR25 family glycosyltransferase involved in LPS biosynthesis
MIKGYYINLEERKDRYAHFEKLKNNYSLFKNIDRLSATRDENGAIGCGLSHIAALNKCLEDKDIDSCCEYMMVFEDDFCILNDTHYNEFVNHFENIRNEKEWDIIVLTPRGVMKNVAVDKKSKMASNHFYEIVNNQTATGYIIKKTFIPILINTFEKSVEGLLKKLNPDNYAIDQYWKSLQNPYHFYYFKNVFAGQLPGYSTIEKRMVDYNERFASQK